MSLTLQVLSGPRESCEEASAVGMVEFDSSLLFSGNSLEGPRRQSKKKESYCDSGLCSRRERQFSTMSTRFIVIRPSSSQLLSTVALLSGVLHEAEISSTWYTYIAVLGEASREIKSCAPAWSRLNIK